MATDPDRQSDGRPARDRRSALSELFAGLHGTLQVALALAFTAPLVAKVSEFAGRPTASDALGIVEVSAIWALAALIVWTLRVAALSSCGPWGEATRRRVRNRRREVEAPR